MITGPCYRCKGTGCIEYPALTRVLEAISKDAWCTVLAVSDAVELNVEHVAKQLRTLHRQGMVERRGKGTRLNGYEWRRLW